MTKKIILSIMEHLVIAIIIINKENAYIMPIGLTLIRWKYTGLIVSVDTTWTLPYIGDYKRINWYINFGIIHVSRSYKDWNIALGLH